MLTIPKRALLAAILTSTILVATGLVMATMVTPPGPGHPVGAADLIAQGGGGDCGDRNCDVWDDDPGGGGDNGGGDPGGGGSGGGDGACYFDGGGGGPITVSEHRDQTTSVVLVAQGRTEVPCYLDGAGFYGGDGCYYGDFPSIRPIPPPPEGKTEEDGRYYYLSCLASANPLIFYLSERWVWMDNADVPTITPEQVARAWLASVELHGVQFVLAPPATGSGLVGLPVWLGVDTSDTNAWGGISDSHCISGVCVSIEAQVTEVAWNMGDGTTFTCTRDQHRSWQRGMDFRSPTGCHHYYQRASRHQPDGRYPVTATSHWLVTWSATSTSGVLTTDRTATTSIQIDEIQVLTTR